MSISTKTGDKIYSTNLLDDVKCKIAKNDVFFQYVGELDILHTHVSLLLHKIQDKEIIAILKDFTNSVVPNLYSSLPLAGKYKNKFESSEKLTMLENYIFSKEKILNLENSFYELGQTETSSLVDITRSISRKVEREFVNLVINKNLDENFYLLNFSYLNRFSDFLFIVARIIEKNDNKLKARN